MSKYIDIQNVSFGWDEADCEKYGDSFDGGVLYVLDKLSAQEKARELEHDLKRLSKRRLRELVKSLRASCENTCAMCASMHEEMDRLRSHALAMEVQAESARTNAELLEKAAGLFRPAEAEENVIQIDSLQLSASFLVHGLARPWAFTPVQAARFIELVQEMAERNKTEWHQRWEERQEECLHEKDTDSV